MRNKILKIIIAIATILLAGIAIFTAIRLYQTRQESVAPTAPESEPAAGPVDTVATTGHCSALNFTVTPRVPGLSCEEKEAYKNNSQNSTGNYVLTQLINQGDVVSRNQIFVYSLKYKNTGTKAVASAVVKDTLPTVLTFVDGQQGCSNSQGVITCSVGSVGIGATGRVSIRVKVKSTAAFDTEFTNSAMLDPAEGDNSTCSIALVTQSQGATATPTATPTTPPDEPTPTATATPKVTATPTAPPEEEEEPTPTVTTRATATPRPITQAPTEEPTLPEAGVSTPTLLGFGAGLIFLVIALALAL
jgi:uncharacterized repeat protein (TIGR01451 family)